MAELYAVVDTARDRRLYDLVHDALAPFCLFATDVVSPMGHASPYLVPLANADRLRKAWRTVGRGDNWGIFLRSSQQQARIRRHLRHFNLAKLPDGRVVVFRWWDPRVFRTYIETCAPEDLRTWFSGVEAFICEEAEGSGFEEFRSLGGRLVRERVSQLQGL